MQWRAGLGPRGEARTSAVSFATSSAVNGFGGTLGGLRRALASAATSSS